MITTSFYLDTRAVKPGAEAPLKISVTKDGSTAYIKLGLSIVPKCWNKELKKVVSHPRKTFLNTYLQQKKLEIDEIVLTLMKQKGHASMSVTQVKNHIVAVLNPVEEKPITFSERILKYADLSNPRTKEIYLATYNRLKEFNPKFDKITFEEITVDWLKDFDTHLKKNSPAINARSIHFRNIRAVFNDARRNGITNEYPFAKGKFEIKSEGTRKRALSIDIVRKIFFSDFGKENEMQKDLFKLIFYLIGINFIDLCNLQGITDGRIEYKRAKTKRLYSIKVEPEALEIIEKYKGKGQLLFMLDHSTNYRRMYTTFSRGLSRIKEKIGIPDLSSYWARHTWATIAHHLDIPKETIAHALGHGDNTVTDIYIDFNQNKVDDANRKVIDFILNG